MKHFQYDVATKSGRARLPERQEPFWSAPIADGAAVGYRTKGTGSWIARWRDRNGKRHYQALGAHPDFNSARAAAAEWIGKMSASSRRRPARGTVRDALCSYVRHLRSIGRRATAWETGQRFRLTVGRTSEFGGMKLKDVSREDTEGWRNGLKKGRANRSINRQVRAVRAALNYAVEHAGHIGNPKAWKLSPLVDDAEANSPIFLTPEQRSRIIAAAPAPLANLLRGYEETGARPSELALAVVADFDVKSGAVTLRHRKGRGGKQRARSVPLSDSGAEFFREQARGKLPKAPLISNAAGNHWTDQEWCGSIAAAIVAANKTAKPAQRIPPRATCYSFRHSRASELLQLHGIDPVTCAHVLGTSVLMIEKYYFKFIGSELRLKLNAIKSA